MATAVATDRGRLTNGVRFLVRERPAAVTTVSVWILAGSRDEEVPGVAHLLEHVVMQAVPVGRQRRVVDEIESYGADANAVTSREYVVLYARVPTPDAPAALDLLSCAAAGAGFDDRLVASERRVVLEELRLAAADPADVVHDVFYAQAFGAHPMGRPVGGTSAGVRRLATGHLTAWLHRHRRPGRLGVVVSGGEPVDAVADRLAAGPLAALTAAEDPAAADPAAAVEVVAGRRDLSLPSDTTAVVVGGPAFPLADPRLAVADIVLELLAGANASVLGEEVRTRRGLSYDISPELCGYRDTGVWRIGLSTAPEHRDRLVDLTTELLTATADRGWSEADVAVARRRVAGLVRLDTEASIDDALLHGERILVGDSAEWSLPAYLDHLATIGADQVNECARLMLDRLVVATAGPRGHGTEAKGGRR
jgi:predicted Zn-dependent peptidase